MEEQAKQKFIVLGPMDAGKSTLANALINGRVTPVDLRRPLRTGNDMSGCTTKYTCNSDGEFTIIDTVGLTDNRSTLDTKAKEIAKIIWELRNGVNGILFCMQKGKVDCETRRTIQAVLKMFDADKLRNMSLLVLTHDEDGTGKQWIQRQISELRDPDAEFIYETVGKRCESGTLQSFEGTDQARKDESFREDRETFLRNLQSIMRTFRKQETLSFDYSDHHVVVRMIAEMLSVLIGEPVEPQNIGEVVRKWFMTRVAEFGKDVAKLL